MDFNIVVIELDLLLIYVTLWIYNGLVRFRACKWAGNWLSKLGQADALRLIFPIAIFIILWGMKEAFASGIIYSEKAGNSSVLVPIQISDDSQQAQFHEPGMDGFDNIFGEFISTFISESSEHSRLNGGNVAYWFGGRIESSFNRYPSLVINSWENIHADTDYNGIGISDVHGIYGAFWAFIYRQWSDINTLNSKPWSMAGDELFRPKLDLLVNQVPLPKHSPPLTESGDCEDACGNEQIPIVRRFFVCIFGFLIGSPLVVFGFDNIYNKRRIRGSLLLAIGLLCGASGMALLVSTDFRSTWSWWL